MKAKVLISIICLIAFTIASINCMGQNSELWENYVNATKNNTEPILPNFSYAGYKYSEVPIPNVDYPIFDITKYGAKANDEKSDKKAIIKAIEAASKKGKGIIYFPKGKYYINTGKDERETVEISTSNIIFRGEDRENTILFFEKDLLPTDPNKLWTTPAAIRVKTKQRDQPLTKIVADARRETHTIQVKSASKIKKGDWITLIVNNNSEDLIRYELKGLKLDPKWTLITEKGVMIKERHQVAEVKGNKVTLVEPIHYDIKAEHNWKVNTFAHLENVGFENITFEGNWLKKFEHHRSAQDDGGWKILHLTTAANSWVQNCTFRNVTNCLGIAGSAACTALNISVEGNIGHNSVNANHSTGILLAKIDDKIGMHHATGVAGRSMGTVIWRCKHPKNTSFEAHASQPRCTLFDNVEGGFLVGRAGGARKNLPNHGQHLVLWNYKEIGQPESNFAFDAKDSPYWKFVPPIIVGFHGVGTTFKKDEVQVLESLGTPVKPESLFEEQLKLRLGKLPKWLEEEKAK